MHSLYYIRREIILAVNEAADKVQGIARPYERCLLFLLTIMPSIDISYKIANTEQEFALGRELFQQYAASLGIDLSFQDFDTELKTINKQYHQPNGALLLAYANDLAIGCAAIRQLDPETAELKRMFAQADYRKYKIGYNLLAKIIDIAKEFRYHKIRLDTLQEMKRAQSLYRAFGFYEIPPYRFNPIPRAVYMEKALMK